PQTENTKPPRALWVPFELGRPFGPPSDAAFQRRVILAALGLLEREGGPVLLADFPDDDPPAAPDPARHAPTLAANARPLGDWRWDDSSTGAAIHALRAANLASEDERLKLIAGNFLVPATRVRTSG